MTLSILSRRMRYYLAKSEPETRLERGVDVSFPLSRLASSPSQRTTWEGVRNPVAGKTLKGMAIGDQVLFYHSNCKLPGIAGLTEVSGEPRPDDSAWNPKHPYYDVKTDKDNPKWFMPEVKYVSTLEHFVSLALLQHISAPGFRSTQQRKDVEYLSDEQLASLAEMDLLKKGRLSVQNVSKEAFDAILAMGARGGWQDWKGKWNAAESKTNKRKAEIPAAEAADDDDKTRTAPKKAATASSRQSKRSQRDVATDPSPGRRRSSRSRAA